MSARAVSGAVGGLCAAAVCAAVFAGGAPAGGPVVARGAWGGSTGGIWHYLRFRVVGNEMRDIVVAYSCRRSPGLRGSFFYADFPDTPIAPDGSFRISFGDQLSLRGRFVSRTRVRGNVNPTSNPLCADGRFAFSAKPVATAPVARGAWRGTDETGGAVSFLVTRDGFVHFFRDNMRVNCARPLPSFRRAGVPLFGVDLPIRHTGRVIGKLVVANGAAVATLDARFTSSRTVSGTMSYAQIVGGCASGVVRWAAQKT